MSWRTNSSGAGLRLRFWLFWRTNPSRARSHWWFYRRCYGRLFWHFGNNRRCYRRGYRWRYRRLFWHLWHHRGLFWDFRDDGWGHRRYRWVHRCNKGIFWILWIFKIFLISKIFWIFRIDGICWGNIGINRVYWRCSRIDLLTGRCHRRTGLLLACRHRRTRLLGILRTLACFFTGVCWRAALIIFCRWLESVVLGALCRLTSILGNGRIIVILFSAITRRTCRH